jgi:hypothetical protein
MVYESPGGESGKKMEIYADLGVLYYVVYNHRRNNGFLQKPTHGKKRNNRLPS